LGMGMGILPSQDAIPIEVWPMPSMN